MSEKNASALHPVLQQFGAVAAAYATSSVHRDGADLRLLVEAAELSGSERVLDLGCGAGHTALACARQAAEVVAIDVTAEMLAVARHLAAEAGLDNVSFRAASAAELPFPDASFDVATSRFSAHHFDDPARALAEAARVLKPGGLLLLADSVAPESPALDTFNNAVELLRDRSHVRNWRVSDWERLLRGAGFEPEVLLQGTIDLVGDEWVGRSQTPPDRVTAIKALFAGATDEARDWFALREGEGWGWRIPMALLRGRLQSQTAQQW